MIKNIFPDKSDFITMLRKRIIHAQHRRKYDFNVQTVICSKSSSSSLPKIGFVI